MNMTRPAPFIVITLAAQLFAAFYELHVWAWRDNPHGAFVDWHTRVSCEGQ